MDNKTLKEFMRDHHTMVEDLREAASLLPPKKRSLLVGALQKYADELAEYDVFLCKEFINPFKIQTMNEAIASTIHSWKGQTDWDISPEGDLCHKKMAYHIYSNQLKEKDWILHMMEKGWCNLNTFIPAYFEACNRAGIKELPIKTSYIEN